MSDEFAGKVALVTGGGSGIGAATALAFARAGAYAAILDRDAAAAEAVAAVIAARGGRATGHMLDVADGPAFARVAAAIAEEAGGIDILSNSAGTITRHTIAQMPTEVWERVLAVNLCGPFNGIQAALPYLRARGGGAVVNIASVAGRRILLGGGAHYSASEPSCGATPDMRRTNRRPIISWSTPSAPARPRRRSAAACRRPKPVPRGPGNFPLGRMVEPEDVADTVLFLAGDPARMCTGIALDVDGGILISNDILYEEYFSKMT
jgi:NAD(P)-dependent dehydrogenase (short-subunit alcohol dehydrogenase family)